MVSNIKQSSKKHIAVVTCQVFTLCRHLTWALSIVQERMRTYLPGRKIYLFWKTGQQIFLIPA